MTLGINLLDIRDGLIWGMAGEVGISFELFPGIDLRTCSSGALPGFITSFSRLLSSLPIRYGVTFEVEIEQRAVLKDETAQNGLHPMLKDIYSQKMELMAGSGRIARYFMHVWAEGPDPLQLPLLPSFAPWRKRRALGDQIDATVTELENVCSTILASLANCQGTARRLSNDEMINRYWSIVCPKSSQSVLAFTANPDYSLASKLSAANAEEAEQYFFIDGTYHVETSFYTYPNELQLGRIDELIEILPVGARYIFSLLVPSQTRYMDRLKRLREKTLGITQGTNAKDYEGIAKERGLDAVISKCIEEGERLYTVWGGVILRSSDIRELAEWQQMLLRSLSETIGVGGLIEDLLHRRLFLASLPFQSHLSPRRILMLGSTAAALVPLTRPWTGTKETGMIFFGRIEKEQLVFPSNGKKVSGKEAIMFDLFDGNTPQNGMIIGKKGQGKSFTANVLLSAILRNPDIRVMCIDIGNSYKKLTEILGGAFYDVRLDERFAVNPILPRSVLMNEDGTIDAETIGAQRSLLAKIIKNSTGPALAILERALRKALEQKEEPLLSDIYSVLQAGPWEKNLVATVDTILSEMMPYCEGVYANLLSRPSRIRPFERQITTFELGGLSQTRDLQSIMVSVIAFALHRQMNDRGVKKVVVIDEAWEFFNDPQSAEFIEKLYRQGRKHNVAILVLSQNPEEFLKASCSAAMRGNSDWVMALKMESGHELLSEFGFTDQAIQISKSMAMSPRQYSEVLIRHGSKPARIVRVAPTSLEYWMFTTNAEECKKAESLAEKENLNSEQTVRRMAQLYPAKPW